MAAHTVKDTAGDLRNHVTPRDAKRGETMTIRSHALGHTASVLRSTGGANHLVSAAFRDSVADERWPRTAEVKWRSLQMDT